MAAPVLVSTGKVDLQVLHILVITECDPFLHFNKSEGCLTVVLICIF